MRSIHTLCLPALAVVVMTATLVGCDSVASPITTTLPTTTSSVTSTAPPTSTEPTDPCPSIEPAVAPAAAVHVTLRQRFEELIDPNEIGLCVRISNEQGVVYQAGFDMLGIEWSNAGRKLAVVPLPPDEYTVAASVVPSGRGCTTTVDLSDRIGLTVVALFRLSCSFQVEETEPWREGNLGPRVPPSVITEYFGPGHCGWDQSKFLVIDTEGVSGVFLRDPGGRAFGSDYFLSSAFRDELGLEDHEGTNVDTDDVAMDAILTLDLDAVLPSDAVSLGYVRGNRELYVSPSSARDYLYVVTDDAVERWPRMRPEAGCA